MKTKNWILIGIMILAAVLRLWKLNVIPPHLTPDEASLGYNAYSILKTGKDEYGNFLPLIFKSFGDYKPGLYVYLTVPFVAVFGLNEWTVRIPSALAGIISVYLLYLIIKKLFPDSKYLPFIGSFLLAVSPWNIQLSRGAWEVNVSLTLTLAATYFFLQQKYYKSALFFGLTLLCYQGAKLSSLIVLFVLVLTYWKELDFKKLIKPALLGLIISLPIILSIFQGKAGRLNVFSVFSHKRPIEYIEAMLNQNGEKIGDINYLLFHNDIYDQIRGIMGRYFNMLSGRFLFFEGDYANPRHTPPNQGVLLFSDILLLLIGFYFIFNSFGSNSKTNKLILLWLFLSPLPAVLSRDQVHAVRSLGMSIPLIIISAVGVSYALKRYGKYAYILAVPFLLSFGYYLDSYFIHLPKHDSKLWEYGFKQVVETITPIQDRYKIIKVQQSYAQPYIYFLFFQKYDPVKYQNQAKLKESEYGDVGQVEKLDNIEFCGIDWSVARGEHGTIFVADPVRIPPEDSKNSDEFKIINEKKYLNGRDIAFRIIEVK